jgi:pantetheine-phosphate adenylyltransferase
MASEIPVRRVAVFPGQFDPITLGHIDIIRRAVNLFEEVIVAVGINPDKRELFTHDQRLSMIQEVLADIPRARAAKYDGLTVDFVRSVNATVIVRGIRDVSDLHHEFQLALANRAVGGIETVFVMTADQYALTSSSLIRQVVALGGDLRKLSTLVPPIVVRHLEYMQRRGINLRTLVPDAPAT